jgi:Protein of unknown function (DUF664)
MPGMPPPASGERQTLLEFLRFNQNAFFAVAYGLTDEQARSTPSVSALSIGGLIKHATGVQRSWMERVNAAPDYPPRDERPMEEIMAEYADQYAMRDDESLDQLLDGLKAQNEDTLKLGRAAPARGADAARGPRRHHPRIRRRRNDVRAHGRQRGVAGNRVAQALEGQRLISPTA